MKRSIKSLTTLVLAGALLVVASGVGTAGDDPEPQHSRSEPRSASVPSPSSKPASKEQTTTDCARYRERRQFVEAQGWWTRTPGLAGNDFGHVHVGACIPERETIRGVVPLDIRLVMHDNPGLLRYVAIVVKGQGYETTVARPSLAGFTCPKGTCTGWIHYHLETAAFQYSGRQEIRLRALFNAPDGNSMHGGLNFQVNVDNGKPRRDYGREPFLRGKGWFTPSGYCESTFRSVAIPDAPVSGTWSPTVAMVEHSTGTVNDRISHHSIRLDPDLHNGVQGTLLADVDGPWEGAIAIDTKTLANGVHRLMLKAECANAASGSTNAGVLVIPFVVSN